MNKQKHLLLSFFEPNNHVGTFSLIIVYFPKSSQKNYTFNLIKWNPETTVKNGVEPKNHTSRKNFNHFIMKNFILIFVLFITGLTTNNLNAQGSWFSQTNPTSDSGESMQFVSATEGWISLQSNALLHTTNGGINWQVVIPNATDVTAGMDAPGSRLSFINTTTGWVFKTLGSNDSPQGAVLYKTSNGGSTWERTLFSSTPGDAAIQVQFVNATNGWILIYNMNTGNVIYKKTSDGGSTWTPTAGGGIFYYVNAAIGYSFSAGPNMIPPYTIYKTTDGGTYWLPQYVDNTAGEINDIRFTDENNGWAVGNNGKLFKTTDGGANWIPSIYNSNYKNNKVFFINNNNNNIGWIGTTQENNNSKMLSTTNGGMSWTEQTLPFNYKVYSMSFWDANNGWAAADYGGLARYMYDPLNTYKNSTLIGPWFIYNSNPIDPYNDNLNYMIFNGAGSIVGFNGFPAPASGNYNVNPDGTFNGNLIIGAQLYPISGLLTSQNQASAYLMGNWTMTKLANSGVLKDKITGTLTSPNCGTKNVVINIDNSGTIVSATGLVPPVAGNVFEDQGVFLGHITTGELGTPWHEFSIMGTYSNDNLVGKISLDGNDCNISTSLSMVRSSGLGINDNLLKKSISIYPNPNNGKFNIDSKDVNPKIQIEIYNVWGQKINTEINLKQTTNIIDLRSYSKGVYFIKINDGENSYTEKMVIE